MNATNPRLRINFYAIGIPFNGDTIKTKALGGSETAAYYLARELAARGHHVVLWTADKQGGMFDGVLYSYVGEHTNEMPLGERFEHYARNTPHDVLIVQRGAGAFTKPFASKVNIWQLHDLALHRFTSPMMGGMFQIDAVTTVSDWHKKQVVDVWNINPAVLHTVRNGVDLDLYDVAERDASKAEELTKFLLDVNPNGHALLLYQSRPERGLENLVKPGGIMERIKDLPVKLLVGGYKNDVAHMADYYAKLQDWAKLLPNVTYIDPLSKQELALLQKKCDLLLYPTAFEEVSCITAMEAIAANLPILTTDAGALPETCSHSGTEIIPLVPVFNTVNEIAFVDQLLEWFGSDSDGAALNLMKRKQAACAPLVSWRWPTDALEELCYKLLANKLSVPAVLRHALEHSDIDFAKWVIDNKLQDDAISKSVFTEIDRLYDFTTSDDKYATHYRKHCGIYYDGHEENVIGENVTHSTRYRGVLGMVAEARNKLQRGALKIMDYGCAHGHYVIPLAKTFADCNFVGVDISDRAIGAAKKWAAIEKLTNVDFRTTNEAIGTDYDVILAAEVLEHVRSDQRFLEQLRSRLKPGGCIIFTTPNGRWEWTGTVPFRSAREHLRHYEREDIVDIAGDNVFEISHAPAGTDPGGRAMGSWVWCVWPANPFGKINYERKYALYAPRETISACLIVKDGEKTIRKCIESFIDFVDEVRVSVDPQTTDRTLGILEDLRTDFPNRPIHVTTGTKSATVDGFDEARNESIEGASGDWILWADADEEVRRPNLLHLFLRPSMHNGYGFSQVHYSADPDQVLTTDFPCRLFRNKIGIKFYGVVHEHPESKLGEAVTWSLVRPEVKFLHAGYIDEAIRKQRYERNLPLVLRDRKKYPTRELNKFLMLRDTAQGLMFEHKQTGGMLMPDHKTRAQEGIKIMEDLVETSKFVRMIADGMMYYSHCVATCGIGFDAEFTLQTKNDTASDLNASLNVKGRFHSREFFNKVVSKFSQESTKLYEDRYL